MYEDAGTAAGILRLVERHINIFPQSFVIRRNKTAGLLPVVRADNIRISPFYDTDNFPFLAMTTAVLNEPHFYLIIIHGRMAIGFGYIYIVL